MRIQTLCLFLTGFTLIYVSHFQYGTHIFSNMDLGILRPTLLHHQSIHGHSKRMVFFIIEPGMISLHHG